MLESRDVLIARILNHAPFQLPPIVRASGCYTLDISYLGQPLSVTSISLEECLQSYWNHVSKVNYMHSAKKRVNALADLPVPLGQLNSHASKA